MKKIKVYALPSHQTVERTSGVDFARVIQPMTLLNGYKDKDIEIETHVFQIEEKTDWLKVAKEYDVIYFNYIADSWGFAAMGAMARHFKRKLILDLDDNLWGIQEDNPAHSAYHKGSQALLDFVAICNEVDLMTTTGSYLKNVIINNTYKRADKIQVVPNFLDLQKYNHRSPFKNTKRIQLLHYGSTTHFIDLSNKAFLEGVDRIMKDYPNVSIKFVGAFLPKLKDRWGQRYEVEYGDTDIHKWIANKFPVFMDQTDILVVPLEENVYTRCKSNIKYLEASSAGIPGVYQRIRQYNEVIEEGKNGFTAHTSDQWYEAIKKLIDDATLRQTVGENAYQTVKRDWQMQDHIEMYADVIKRVLDK